MSNSKTGTLQRWGMLGIIALSTILAYWPAFHAGFIWDDPAYVTNNPNLETLHGLYQIWFKPGSYPTQYYPLTLTGFWIQYHLWQLNPLGYHAVNILMHLLNAILFGLILQQLVIPGAWFAALLFALHPVHVESVAWISELKNTSSTFFYLLAMWSYLQYAFYPSQGDLRLKRMKYGATLVFFMMALFCKTAVCTLPVGALLLVWWRKGTLEKRDTVPLIPFFALGLAMSGLTIWLEKNTYGANGAPWDLSFAQHLYIASRALGFYARELFWPHPLIFIYPRWSLDIPTGDLFFTPVTVAAVFTLLWILRHRLGRGPLVGLLFFACTLFPVLGFFNVYPMTYSFVADHFQYLASLGLITLFAALVVRLSQKRGVFRFIFAIVICIVLGLDTHKEIGKYQDSETLWEDTLAKNPGAAIAHTNLAELSLGKGDLEDACRHFSQALALNPQRAEYHYNYAFALTHLGQLDEAIAEYETAIALEPENSKFYDNLGIALAKKGRIDEAIQRFQQALRLNPDSMESLQNLKHAQQLRNEGLSRRVQPHTNL